MQYFNNNIQVIRRAVKQHEMGCSNRFQGKEHLPILLDPIVFFAFQLFAVKLSLSVCYILKNVFTLKYLLTTGKKRKNKLAKKWLEYKIKPP